MNSDEIKTEIRHLTMAYGSYVVMRDINARVKRGSIFVIMGESGAGKSTLLRNMIGYRQHVSWRTLKLIPSAGGEARELRRSTNGLK
jgi:phospholipid/cholesterol/gamma-HCH transport system ATP-binding protein